MSKQNFTTGQVLTAAQVNSLQSNDFNQTVSVKTAAYTLVAADKGTRIEFNTSGSVACTVNTGIFDAGDTLVIQNRGAGTVTITAGTATVNTSGSLALTQYSAGTLYFVSASAALFFGGAAASGGLTLINTGGTTLSGSSTSITSIPGTYKNLHIWIENFTGDDDNRSGSLRFNTITTSSYQYVGRRWSSGGTGADLGANGTSISIHQIFDYVSNGNFAYIMIPYYANTNSRKMSQSYAWAKQGSDYRIETSTGVRHDSNDAITSLQFVNSGSWGGGTVYIYGES